MDTEKYEYLYGARYHRLRQRTGRRQGPDPGALLLRFRHWPRPRRPARLIRSKRTWPSPSPTPCKGVLEYYPQLQLAGARRQPHRAVRLAFVNQVNAWLKSKGLYKKVRKCEITFADVQDCLVLGFVQLSHPYQLREPDSEKAITPNKFVAQAVRPSFSSISWKRLRVSSSTPTRPRKPASRC